MSDGNVINLADRQSQENRRAGSKGVVKTMIGQVASVTDLSDRDVVAFHVRNGTDETLFWISTKVQEDDADYRKPLMGESVKVWFNEAVSSINVGDEKALGVVEIQNISNDSEQAAFAWFAAHPDGPPWLKP